MVSNGPLAGRVPWYSHRRTAIDDLDHTVDDRQGLDGRRCRGLNAADVFPGLAIRRHAIPVPLDRLRTRVIRGQRQRLVVAVPGEELLQVRHAAANVLCRIVGIRHAKLGRCCRHQLHEPHRPLWRTGTRVEAGFHLDDGPNQLRPDTLAAGGVLDQLVIVPHETTLGGPRDKNRRGPGNRKRACLGAGRRGVFRQDKGSRRVCPRVDLGLRPLTQGRRRAEARR